MKNEVYQAYRAGVYLRVSKDDAEKEISDSILNQKDLIFDFLKNKTDITAAGEFIDDGFSGVDFERPAFSRLLAEIESGRINCVIVKDLSRFGRNYIEAGRLLEQKFPAKNIRFIAINDGYDSVKTVQSDDLLIPFKNMINDAYCRDISIKIRSQLQVKRLKGDFISPFAVYGYAKSNEDKHRLEIDEYAANIVRDIFNWKLDGISQQRIADRLNEKSIMSPMDYKCYCGMNFKSGFQVNARSKWTAVTVGRILKNEVYTGTLVQGKKCKPNHKVKKLIDKPESEWIKIPNNHDAIISVDIFNAVNGIMKQDIRIAPNQEAVYLFSGLLFCGDCGKNMVRNGVSQKGKSYSYYMCFSNRTEKVCTSHRISDTKLEKAVLQVFRQHVINLMNAERVLKYVNALPLKRNELKQTDKLINQKLAELERYNRLKTKLYESMADGLIDSNEYTERKCAYDEKLRQTEEAVTKLKADYNALCENTGSNEWVEQFKRHKDITELTRPIAITLIDRINIYENRRIEVIFKYQYNYERILDYIQSVHDAYPLETQSSDLDCLERGVI